MDETGLAGVSWLWRTGFAEPGSRRQRL